MSELKITCSPSFYLGPRLWPGGASLGIIGGSPSIGGAAGCDLSGFLDRLINQLTLPISWPPSFADGQKGILRKTNPGRFFLLSAPPGQSHGKIGANKLGGGKGSLKGVVIKQERFSSVVYGGTSSFVNECGNMRGVFFIP